MIWVFLAPLFYSAMSITAKLAGGHMGVWQVGMGRFLLGLLLMPVIVRTLRLSLWGQQRPLLFLRGACGAAAFLMIVAAFQRIPLSMAMVLFYLYPALTTLLSPLITGERADRKAWCFVGSAFAGTTLILWPAGSTADLNLGHALAVAAALLGALTLLLVRRLGRHNNIFTLYFYLCVAGVLASLPPLLAGGEPLLPQGSMAWLWLAAVAVASVGAQLSINQALTRFPAPRVSVMMTSEVALVAAFGSKGDRHTDFNEDGRVDLTDFALQRASFGVGAGSSPLSNPTIETPEPATLTLLAIGGLAVLKNLRRRK